MQLSSRHACSHLGIAPWLCTQVSSRDEHRSGLDRIGTGLKPILAGSGLDRTAIFFKFGGSW